MTGIIGMSCREMSRFSECYDSLMNLQRPLGTHFIQCRSMHGPANWNLLGKLMLERDLEWLFCTEDDHIYQPHTLMRLLEHDKDIVSGLYLKRDYPFEPVAYYEVGDGNGSIRSHYLDDSEGGLVEVDAVGVGCLLIRRKVFETLPAPWWILTAPPAAPDMINSDVEWCRAAKRHGFSIWCDLDLSVGHVAVTPIVPMRQNGQWKTFLVIGLAQGIALDPARSPLAIKRNTQVLAVR